VFELAELGLWEGGGGVSEAIKVGHEIPINHEARMIFAKAPWWSKPPSEAKFHVLNIEDQCTWTASVDYFRRPPEARGNNMQVTDRRGWLLQNRNEIKKFGCSKNYVVLGYAYTERKRYAARNKYKSAHYWHAFDGDSIVTINMRKTIVYPEQGGAA
jgi:hypothetical protein